ncbi:MAG: DSD1 family PLP-dependent enzyme, partial [Solirubrobacteraceae bacterium]
MATDASAHLIGRPGSRDALATPALVLDLDAFERNLVRMAELMASAGCRLRPHAKAHKCAEAGRRQIAAGEVMAAAGIGDLLVTSPVAGRTMLERLIALNARSEG